MSFNFSNSGIIVTLLNESVKPIFLLGAGASKQSGVKLVNEVVEEIAKWHFCRENGYPIDDPRITMSDWKKWIAKFPWYNEDYGILYPTIVEELLTPRQTRKDFFLRIINPPIPASRGYEILAELMHLGLVDTVLTTNFDNCLHSAGVQVRKQVTHIIKTPSDLTQLSYTPRYSQLLYLHGSVEHYTDQNLKEETEHLNADLVSRLIPLLKDRPIVVIGYRGFEKSVMQDLFLDNIEATNSFHQGIYWCLLEREVKLIESQPSIIPNYVYELADKTKGNFKIIPINGFDELMQREVYGRLKATEIDLRNITSSNNAIENIEEFIGENTLGDLEIALIRERVTNYSKRLNIKVYNELEWLYQQMCRLKVAYLTNEGKVELNKSGVLLFSSKTQEFLPHAEVILKFVGDEKWLNKVTSFKSEIGNEEYKDFKDGFIKRKITGNLWNQLNQITDSLTLINRPFRLKGDKSEDVYPYPNIALKEVIVNCLVHRDYNISHPINIEIYSTHIKFSSPGGLVEEVKRQIGLGSIEDEIKNGRKGIKGYRNPVIADQFYGAGAMDKEGSGLSDVYKQVESNSGKVSFGPSKNEDFFEVNIFCRPEAIDELTQTASPLVVKPTRYATNVLEVLSLPSVIYFASTEIRRNGEIFREIGESWVPPFVLQDKKIVTFYDLSKRDNPLHPFIDMGTLETYSIEEYIEIKGGYNQILWLLNSAIMNHLFSIQLRVDKKKKRAYFTCNYDNSPKEITYQGRLKRATRTVAKPRINSSSNKISYWEHQSIWYRFEMIGESWFLVLNPSYVFTIDGVKSLLKSERVNILSTKRASRDYNMTVHNNLTFWSRYISEGSDGVFSLNPYSNYKERDSSSNVIHPKIILSSALETVVVNDITVSQDFIEPVDYDGVYDAEQELEIIANNERNTDGN